MSDLNNWVAGLRQAFIHHLLSLVQYFDVIDGENMDGFCFVVMSFKLLIIFRKNLFFLLSS